MTRWNKKAKKRQEALKLLLDTVSKEIYEESMIYGEDLNRDGFVKYLSEKAKNINSVLECRKDIKDSEKAGEVFKQMILQKALMGYRQGLINVGYIEEKK